jgi:hypothetical protein
VLERVPVVDHPLAVAPATDSGPGHDSSGPVVLDLRATLGLGVLLDVAAELGDLPLSVGPARRPDLSSAVDSVVNWFSHGPGVEAQERRIWLTAPATEDEMNAATTISGQVASELNERVDLRLGDNRTIRLCP